MYSIIAVHGLNPRNKNASEHAWDTWRTPYGPIGHLWLRDVLPQSLPDSRIFLYQYNATAVYSQDRDTFIDKANELLEAVRIEREEIESRPIIFLGHSMGGLLIKQALINAHNNPKYMTLKDATWGLAFFATPHNGGDWKLVSLGGIATKIAGALGFRKGDNIIEVLKTGSMFSDIMQEHWRHRLLDYSILSFWGSLDDAVPRESARLGLPGDRENIIKLDADHIGVCKFGTSQTDLDNLKLVRANLRDMYKEVLKKHSHLPCHYTPLAENKRFTGREGILYRIEEMFLCRDKYRKLSIVGLGGIGKTQVALRFAYWVKAKHSEHSILWVPALSSETFEQAYAEVAKRLDIQVGPNEQDLKESVQQYFSSDEAGKWLLILDNADDIELVLGSSGKLSGLCKYLPQSENGIILFTTRSTEVAISVAGNDVVNLQEMDLQEARSLFERCLVRGGVRPDENEISELLHELTCLPLAISQAAAYLNRNKMPVKKYLEFLRGTEKDILSFEQIRKSDGVAADLLAFLSCIEPKAIPQSILPGAQSEETEYAIGTLCGYTFLVRRGENNVFDMHNLVHIATRIWIRQSRREKEVTITSLCHIEKLFSRKMKRREYKRYFPHVFRILDESKDQLLQERFDLFYKLGVCLFLESRCKEAMKAMEKSYKWNKYHLLDNDSFRLEVEVQLAITYTSLGLSKNVIEILKDVVAIDQIGRTKKSRELLYLGFLLGWAYVMEGGVKSIQRAMFPEDSHDRLFNVEFVARAYRFRGHIREAMNILERTVAMRKTFPPDSVSRFDPELELAVAYLDRGYVRKPTQLLDHVELIAETTLPEEDMTRLYTATYLSDIYINNGRVEKAVEMLEHVIDVYKRTQPEDYPRRLIAEKILGNAYIKCGMATKGFELLDYVMAMEAKK
ncbi:uncharacterized protein F4822DRAFT_436211 [Hypoxylon trugodes]|uniref:uncharacterized protein n=1 Tax=Hypoxylon trugodes TaxID=326681 RepID=UPI00219CD408|nr:uncharacterized protein F4822DRAFT_436211 [Hypoxylon trugodes]KAI1392353.1 hypothetical protein F4822DRAFT_436211 [Hypoxylon trugodes]